MDKSKKLKLIKDKKKRQKQSDEERSELLRLIHEAVRAINQLPDEIKSKLPEEKHGDQTVTVSNIGDLEKHLKDISGKIKQPDVKVDLSEVTKLFKRTLDHLKKVEDKEVNVLVNKEIEFPREPKDAIPVVLVDRDRKAFYEAVRRVTAGGGGGVQASLINNDRIKVDSGAYKQIIEEDGTTIYIGEAEPGSGEDEAKWRIQKVEDTGTIEITWAGLDFTAVWDNRETEVYA